MGLRVSLNNVLVLLFEVGMYPYIELFGRVIPSYGLMGGVGFCLGLFYILLFSRRFGLRCDDGVYIFTWGSVGALLGAKLLYLLVSFSELIKDLPLILNDFPLFFAKYFSGGMVFYGGLLGGIAGALLATRYFRLSLKAHFPVLVPALIIFSAVGRVGCFLTGCCYGIPTSSALGVHYPVGGIAPAGVSLLPVQLFEAAADLLLLAVIVFMSHSDKLCDILLPVYITLYAVIRFVLEFFRGDLVRGVFFGLSTSQWISLAAFLFGIISIIKMKKSFNG